MVWNDGQLVWSIHNENLVTPFDAACVNPASIDLRIGGQFIHLDSGDTFEDSEIIIFPGHAILATTIEIVHIPNHAAASIYLKSSLARQGLDHTLAGWIDPGFNGQITMELHAHRPIRLQAGQRVIQMVVSSLSAPALKPYQGRYQGQRGPTSARGAQ